MSVSAGVTAWSETQHVYSSPGAESVGPHLSMDLIASIGGSWIAGLTTRYQYVLYLNEQKPRATALRGSIGGQVGYLFGETGGIRQGPRLALSPYFNAYREENRKDASFGGILELGYIGFSPRGGVFWSGGFEGAAAGASERNYGTAYLSYGVFLGAGFSIDVRASEQPVSRKSPPAGPKYQPLPPEPWP